MLNKKQILWLTVVFIILLGVLLLLTQVNSSSKVPKVEAVMKTVAPVEQGKHYVGAQVCQSCHTFEYQQWQLSDHFKAMQQANHKTVLGDFSGVSVNFHSISSHLYQHAGKYLIDTVNAQGKSETFEIKHTFGHFPLQQYLVETQNGHLQALNIAWDSRPKEEGGQRWFHLQTDEKITPKHPFFWANHFQNWNSRCADCHSTNVMRNYDVTNHRFDTTFSEINVACEACHGAGSQHVALAQTGELGVEGQTGFGMKIGKPLQWQFIDGVNIAEPVGDKNQDDLNMCGPCHSLRSQLSQNREGSFHDLYRLRLLNENTYFADGQIKEEAFVLGSFLQSKMHQKGVTCRNCHDPHTSKTLIDGNGLCSQCHQPTTYDTPKHHYHNTDSEGAQCVNCHMPDRTFMQVDNRRDHSFTIPNADLSLALNVPNACVQCHADKDNLWVKQQTARWYPESSAGNGHWAHLLRRMTQNDVLATRSVVESVVNTELPDLIRASLLQHLAPLPSRVSTEAARQGLQNKNPMVRRAAVASMQAHDVNLRWQTLLPFLGDPSLSVRTQIAETLADTVNQLELSDRKKLMPLIEEYQATLAVSSDSVSTQLSIANLNLRLGESEQAEHAYNQALKIEPAFVPALLGLADFYRRSKRLQEEWPLLEKALSIAPDSGAVQHSVGLFYVRQKQYSRALTYLQQATLQTDAIPYYDYVYSVALENQGKIADAIASLKAANNRWPNQYELLMTLVLYLEKSGNEQSIPHYLSKLSALAPAAPPVKRLVNKYKAGLL